MKMKTFIVTLIIIQSIFIATDQAKADDNPLSMVTNYVPLKLDTVLVSSKESYLLFPEKIENIRFGSSEYSGIIYGKMLKVLTNQNKPTSLLVCCDNNRNYLVMLDPKGNSPFCNLSKKPSNVDSEVSILQAQQDYISNNQIKFNSIQAEETLKEILATEEINSIGTEEQNIGLYLRNYKKDYQLQYFKFVVGNNSDNDFQFDLINTFYKNDKNQVDIFPIARSYTSTVLLNSESMFGFALPKDFNKEFYVELKDRKTNRIIRFLVPINRLSR